MIDFLNKKKLSDFSREEFLSFVIRICNAEGESEKATDIDVNHFDNIVPHPEKSGLIFWPVEGLELETAQDIVNEIERYCKKNDLPCFTV